MSMSDADLEVCRHALSVLTSAKHKNINYIFMEPVDTNIHTTYLDVVKHPMDLRTLGDNLTIRKAYKSRQEFFADARLIFHNAQLFHKGKKETQWIVKAGNAMLKIVNREERAADRKLASSSKAKKKTPDSSNTKKTTTTAKTTPSLKLKLSSSSSSKATPTSTTSGFSNEGDASSATASTTVKPKLSIKLGSSKTDAAVTAATTTDTPASTSVAAAPSSKQKPATTTKTKKPKLKLSLSKTKKQSPASSAAATTTTTTATAAATAVPPPRAPSRGKELPKGIVEAKAAASTVLPSPAAVGVVSKPPKQRRGGGPKGNKTRTPAALAMTDDRKAQCYKVLAGLKRRQPQNVVWFLKPISDKMVIDDYRAKIPHPIDMGTMTTKLDRNDYPSVSDFVRDIRRTFGNCLRYNTNSNDDLRPVAMEMQSTSEELLSYFLSQVPYSRLLYCWKLCVSVLDALLNLTNPTDGHQTAHYFLHPVSFYCGGQFPPSYLQKVTRPMDFGTITSNLMEGVYTTAAEFCADCKLVLQNCFTYYSGNEEGKLFVEQASRLDELMTQQLTSLMRYDASPIGARAAALAGSAVPQPPRPSQDLLMGILQDLRSLTYTDKFTKISEPAVRAFEKPLNLLQHPDYLKVVKTPMDLQMVESRVRSNSYVTLEDFEYDVSLIFRNSDAYNVPRRNDHMVSLSKYCAKQFRKIVNNRLKPATKEGTEMSKLAVKREAPPSGQQQQGPSKKARIEPPSVPPGKAAPRISISASSLASSKTIERANQSRSPKPKEKEEANKPVPLHVAIAQVKERFPLRRPLKYLEPWEAASSRFFRELMKHPWISAARPKFIFVVPVPVLFPDLQEAYTAKIRKPMDLTTVEAKLLQGGLYRCPQDVVDDVALVFSNAITFNKTGKDTGDLLSSAYYDASVQLLRYSRWLSLEVLTPYFGEDSPAETPSEGEPTLLSWKLTMSNKKASREEMESIVLNEPIEKSMEGDRYTWMETECEKLLKALRHQSDAKKMMFFVMPEYPPDYAAFISKPMDWYRINRKLQNRDYDTFGEIIGDLRLIFSNALKYNARAKGTTCVSGLAYDGAVYMSEKLEAAIDKMMVSASDRIERERIEHAIAEREIDAAERAEEEKMRAQWTGSSGTKPADDAAVETVETVRMVQRRPSKRKVVRDFESYFDEDEGSHEQSYIDAMRLQTMIFEKQKLERNVQKSKMASVGAAVFQRLQQYKKASAWAQTVSSRVSEGEASSTAAASQHEQAHASLGSSAFDELNRGDRAQIKIVVAKRLNNKKRKRPRPKLNF